MPRGIPNAKRDENAMRFTTFHVPLPPNPKHMGSTYLRSDTQTHWYRNAVRATAAGRNKIVQEEPGPSIGEARRGSKVIVVHPGSRVLRIGRASDVTPVSIPNVIARKHNHPVPRPRYVEGISRPRNDNKREKPVASPNGDEYAVHLDSDDPFDMKVAAITISLRDRMRFYKLRVTPNAANIASTFNEQFVPETIAEANDPFRVDWIRDNMDQYLVGEQALQIADPFAQDYVVRWPFYSGKFNTRDYPSNAMILSDLETIIRSTLQDRLDIDPKSYEDYSVILVIPDFYDRFYVEDMVRLLLMTMGFKQLCVQQESLAATYGAGISNACVVDMGATKTSIACVDDGAVLGDTRMLLNMGGDDITEFLHVLLQRISFPYKDLSLVRSYDWNVIEDLKARLCTLAEGDVALNLYDFVVRRPGQPTQKYGLRAYDEIILAPMCLFEPRVIEFDQKRAGMRPIAHPDVTEDIVEQPLEYFTQAMVISTQHLLPAAMPHPIVFEQVQGLPQSGSQTPGLGQQPAFVVAPQPAGESAPPQTSVNTVESLTAPATKTEDASESVTPSAAGSGDVAMKEESPTTTLPTPAGSTAPATDIPGAPVEIIDVDAMEDRAAPSALPADQMTQLLPPQQPHIYPGGYTIDVCFEASKLPLDVAIFNSARAAGGDEKIRKYLQAVLVIGGTALVPGMAHALESRLQAIATPLVPNMEKVQIIPPPKDVDPRVLAWKGAAVLGKMDTVSDLWITAVDWDILGMRGLKERCFYL
ncbi:actin-like ATPase domain-containing protein [Fomitopsis serialis]|uniref:actin-like ATPase domain-containing protein n=1 Tax=Fomitopsis serialis TaxID=139415 RepID=UPI002007F204|nr:actin-like ATPase domain-containing protein [Neoantrodia serialis]KAH9926941.1 actin-like ATPase domain-containing protein [Neoantrodia serialis]